MVGVLIQGNNLWVLQAKDIRLSLSVEVKFSATHGQRMDNATVLSSVKEAVKLELLSLAQEMITAKEKAGKDSNVYVKTITCILMQAYLLYQYGWLASQEVSWVLPPTMSEFTGLETSR